jgi:hypothetical protein
VATFWTHDVKKAHLVADRLRAGTVWMNCYNVVNAGAPTLRVYSLHFWHGLSFEKPSQAQRSRGGSHFDRSDDLELGLGKRSFWNGACSLCAECMFLLACQQ